MPQSTSNFDFSQIDFRQLSVGERIELIGEIWDSIEAEQVPELSDDQRAEIERRLADYSADPSRTVPWDEVKAEMRARFSGQGR